MLAARKQKMMIVVFIILGAALAGYLVIYALGKGINVFFTPTEISEGIAPTGKTIRLGGMVKMGSLDKTAQEGTLVMFLATDCFVDIPVAFTGVLPDLFREGQGLVADGILDENGVFQAQIILAKHDENYMPAESAAALEASGGSCE